MAHDEPWSVPWKEKKLIGLNKNWEQCTDCLLHQERTNVVSSHGNPDADFLVLSGSPTAAEDDSGLSLDSAEGELFLTIWKDILGRSESELHFVNIIGCAIHAPRDPTSNEKKACAPRLNDIIYTVDPLLIIALGGIALNAIVGGRKWAITEVNGGLFSSPHPSMYITADRGGMKVPGKVLPLKADDKTTTQVEYDVLAALHPSYVLRTDPSFETTGVFQPGGPAYKLRDALQLGIDLVDELKEKYQQTGRIIERLI